MFECMRRRQCAGHAINFSDVCISPPPVIAFIEQISLMMSIFKFCYDNL